MNAALIRQTLETIALEELEGYEVIPHRFELEANDERALAKGVSALWGAGVQVTDSSRGIDQKVCMEQEFSLDITTRVFARTDDERAIAGVDTVYTAVSRIIKRCVQGRLGIPDHVQGVRLESVSEPRPFNQNLRDIVAVKLSFTVGYIVT